MKERQGYILDGGGDVQTSGAWSGKLPRVNVGNFPDSSVDVFQVLSLHHQDGLGWVEVELQEGEEGCSMMNGSWELGGPVNSDMNSMNLHFIFELVL